MFRRLLAPAALALVVPLLGLLASSPAAADTTAPETRLITKSWSHAAHSATFTLGSSEEGSSFECQLSGPLGTGSWGPCPPIGSSSAQYAQLTDGDYVFRGRARDAAGNVDPTPVVVIFNINVDTVKPVTTLHATTATTSRNASFSFTANEPATFECRLMVNNRVDDWAPCTSPLSYAGLPDASYTFGVRATDLHGEFETIGKSHTWLLDATAPETSMNPYLDGLDASFAFSGGNTHECRLSGPSQAHGWETCRSPRRYPGLAPGAYDFAVRALDVHGNADPSPATHRWQVGHPSTKITSGPKNGGWLLATATTLRYTGSPGTTAYTCTTDGRARSCSSSGLTWTGLGAGTHRFTVAARNGKLTDPTPASRTFTVPVSSWKATLGRGWTKGRGQASFLGRHAKASRKGATMSMRFTKARTIALVATSAPRHGKVKVYVGKRLVRTVSLSAGRTRTSRIFKAVTFTRATSGRVRVVVVSSGRTVRVEGIGVR